VTLNSNYIIYAIVAKTGEISGSDSRVFVKSGNAKSTRMSTVHTDNSLTLIEVYKTYMRQNPSEQFHPKICEQSKYSTRIINLFEIISTFCFYFAVNFFTS